MMHDPERKPSVSDLLREKEKSRNTALGLLLMSVVTVMMTAWIVFLGWAAWSLLGDG